MASRLERLLRPRSIAVFGGREAERVVEQCDRMGFSGETWPVHPTREAVDGRPAFRSVADLPDAPDAAFVGVNRRLTIELLRELARRGAGGAIAYASGFAESDAEGVGLQEALLEAAGDMPVIGPNCYGLINYLDGVALWPDQHGGVRVERGVAIVTQSSNIAINLTMQRRGLPIAYVGTAGNQAQTGLSEIAAGLIADERVTALGLHIEGIDDLRSFEALAAEARARKVPIVAVKVGRTEAARAAAVSHTASLAGADAVADALLRRLGIARVASLPALLETLKLCHVHGALAGSNLASMSCSGGEASLMADSAADRAVRFRPLDDSDKARLKAALGERVSIANPLDYHTYVWGDEAAMTAAFSAMLAARFDLALLVLDFPRLDRCSDADWDVTVRALRTAVAGTGARVAVVASLPENLPEERAQALIAHDIAPLCGLDEALVAAEAAARIGAAWSRPLPPPVLKATPVSAPIVTLDEAEAKRRLTAAGLRVPEGRVTQDAEDAARAAESLGFPVAVKALGLAHKSEAGAVRLNLADADAVRAAAADLARRGAGLLVERMVEDAVAELLIGIVRDPQFGFAMTLGAGGVLVELLDDAATLLLPATEAEVRAALLSLRVARLLSGFRGRPPGDIDAAVDAALAVARFAQVNADSLEELDVNPLMVLPRNRGAIAADALIRIREANP